MHQGRQIEPTYVSAPPTDSSILMYSTFDDVTVPQRQTHSKQNQSSAMLTRLFQRPSCIPFRPFNCVLFYPGCYATFNFVKKKSSKRCAPLLICRAKNEKFPRCCTYSGGCMQRNIRWGLQVDQIVPGKKSPRQLQSPVRSLEAVHKLRLRLLGSPGCKLFLGPANVCNNRTKTELSQDLCKNCTSVLQ